MSPPPPQVRPTPNVPPPVPGDLTDELLAASEWSDELLSHAGIPIRDVPIVTIGGGLGSFAFVDVLRIAGVPANALRVLSDLTVPYRTYRQLARNSQVPDDERLRSDSASVMDNIWGWPSYAWRESFEARTLRGFLAPLFQVATEPILTDYYTPRAGQVYRSVDREMARIGWSHLLDRGQVRVVRRRRGGGYFVVLTPPPGSSPTRRVAYRVHIVHLAVGYPGLRFLPDLQHFRQVTQDYAHVVNAYEPHDHVYQELRRRPSTVLVRGSGIVAMRILQRLIEDVEQQGARTTIIHLFRTYVDRSHGSSVFMRRRGGDGFAYQGFNWPRAAWGGQLKERLERAEGDERAEMLKRWGGTNTPRRKLWQQELRRARQAGFYRPAVGRVVEVRRGPDATILTRVEHHDGVTRDHLANYVIDATGLEADVRQHRLVADLLDHAGAGRNPLGRLDVDRSFEVRGTRSGTGRIYASGSATLGGYYAGVDSFLGLQYTALTIADELAGLGYGHRIGPARSLGQWWRWVRGRPPNGTGA